jgi:redox-sensitive bicupin YhaK (pirin superfamily)
MSHVRPITALHEAQRDDIGDLITRRPLPRAHLHDLDPFLFLNHHGPQTYPRHNDGLPFGPHPHRGFSTLTFIFAGQLAHQDSAGHEHIIGAGGVQWMTAGRGVVHAELSPKTFLENGGPLEIAQLWINLPRHRKMIEPFYRGCHSSDIPCLSSADQKLHRHIICDRTHKLAAPIQPPIDLDIEWIEMQKGSIFNCETFAQDCIFLYVVRGHLTINNQNVTAFTLVEFAQQNGTIEWHAHEDSLLIFGRSPPHKDPIVYGGPFVMNSEDEIKQAFVDYRRGMMGSLA